MLETAKRHVEASGAVKVVGGYVCPTADRFLRKKLAPKANPDGWWEEEPPNFISGRDRCNMAEIMVKDSNWIMVDRFEADNDASGTEGKRQIQKAVSEFYQARFDFDRDEEFAIIGVSGIDAFPNVRSEQSLRGMIFVVNRVQDDGQDPTTIISSHPHGAKANVIWDTEWQNKQVSSSNLRKLWAAGKDVSHITSLAIIECTFPNAAGWTRNRFLTRIFGFFFFFFVLPDMKSRGINFVQTSKNEDDE